MDVDYDDDQVFNQDDDTMDTDDSILLQEYLQLLDDEYLQYLETDDLQLLDDEQIKIQDQHRMLWSHPYDDTYHHNHTHSHHNHTHSHHNHTQWYRRNNSNGNSNGNYSDEAFPYGVQYKQNNNPDSGPRPPLAKLFAVNTVIEPILALAIDNATWYRFMVDYQAYWDSNEPIYNPNVLYNITRRCFRVINATVISGDFYHVLQHEYRKFYQDQQLLQQQKQSQINETGTSGYISIPAAGTNTTYEIPYYNTTDGIVFIDVNVTQQDIIAGVAILGDENSMVYSPGADAHMSGPDGGDEDVNNRTTNGQNGTHPNNAWESGRMYTTPLEKEWDPIQWLGLTLFLVTLAVVALLTQGSFWYKRRQAEQQLWGIHALTEQGVSELLNVGWRYHYNREPQGADDNDNDDDDDDAGHPHPLDRSPNGRDNLDGQLYLQVFDKAKLGYNDDNSMLMGGVVKEGVPQDLTTTIPSSTVTTTTPDRMM